MNSPSPLIVYQFSSVPPPLGGNTVHVLRLHEFLRAQSEIQSHVIDPENPNGPSKGEAVISLNGNRLHKLLQLSKLAIQMPSGAIVHFHLSRFGQFRWAAPILLLLFFRQIKVATIHSGGFVDEVDRPRLRRYVSFILRRMDHVITVNPLQRDFVQSSLGVKANKITVIPAFLPQSGNKDLLPAPLRNLPGETPVVLTSGYLTPIYNYEVLIDCIEQIPEALATFVFAFYHETDANYASKTLPRLECLGNVMIARDLPPAAFVALMQKSDIYVRTTTTDGDAVAVREAFDSGIPVLATDCVPRPPDCRLFGIHDHEALLKLLTETLPTTKNARRRQTRNSFTTGARSPGNADRIVSVYQSLVQRNRGHRETGCSEFSVR